MRKRRGKITYTHKQKKKIKFELKKGTSVEDNAIILNRKDNAVRMRKSKENIYVASWKTVGIKKSAV